MLVEMAGFANATEDSEYARDDLFSAGCSEESGVNE